MTRKAWIVVESYMKSVDSGLVFVNLVDFDTQFGHRNDVEGYARNLEGFDRRLARLLPQLASSDLLVITADHGNDPTTPSTDHSREYVPLLATGPGVRARRRSGTRRDLRRSRPDSGVELRSLRASATARAFSVRSRRDPSRATRGPRAGDPRAAGGQERRFPRPLRARSVKTMSGRRFSAIATASSTARRSGGSSTRRRFSLRRPAITTARASRIRSRCRRSRGPSQRCCVCTRS